MKLVAYLLVGGLIACILFFKQAYLYPESYAKSIVISRFQNYCHDMNLDPNNYIGPSKVEVGNAAWAYEWKARIPQQKDIIGIWLNGMGKPEIYSGPKDM